MITEPQFCQTINYQKRRSIESFGLRLTVSQNGFDVTETTNRPSRILTIEVYKAGLLHNTHHFQSIAGLIERDGQTHYEECGFKITDQNGDTILILDVEEERSILPFMRPNGTGQQHITENYVAVPPALTITDETGAIWTIGFQTAPKDKSPDGEYAYPVLRNGLDTGEIASRIERRNSKIRIFTKHGWKIWTGQSFF